MNELRKRISDIVYLENRMTNRASQIYARRECCRSGKVMPFFLGFDAIFHHIDQAHKFFCGVGCGVSLQESFLKICAKCFITVTDIL